MWVLGLTALKKNCDYVLYSMERWINSNSTKKIALRGFCMSKANRCPHNNLYTIDLQILFYKWAWGSSAPMFLMLMIIYSIHMASADWDLLKLNPSWESIVENIFVRKCLSNLGFQKQNNIHSWFCLSPKSSEVSYWNWKLWKLYCKK